MTKEQMQEENGRLIALVGAAVVNRIVFLSSEIQKMEQRDQLWQKEKEQVVKETLKADLNS